MKYIEHNLGEYKDGIQRCVVCGEIIFDYTNTISPSIDTIEEMGWREGEFYASVGNPSTMLSNRPTDGTITKCKK